MPVIRRGQAPRGGVYAAVRERVEADAGNHAAWCAGWPNQPPYPLQRVLDALRAGEAIDVPAWFVPKQHRVNQCVFEGRRTGATGDAASFWVAIVHPDDTVTFEPGDGSLMVEYLGL